MENEDYIKSIEKEYINRNQIMPEETKFIIDNTLRIYGDNKWWLSEDPKVIGYHQLFEEVLLVSFSKFHEGIEKLLGRPVWTHEFGINMDNIKRDAQLAWEGHVKSRNELDNDIGASMLKLIDFCEENNKPIIGIVK